MHNCTPLDPPLDDDGDKTFIVLHYDLLDLVSVTCLKAVTAQRNGQCLEHQIKLDSEMNIYIMEPKTRAFSSVADYSESVFPDHNADLWSFQIQGTVVCQMDILLSNSQLF